MKRLKQAIKQVNDIIGHERYKLHTFAGKTEVMDLKECRSAQATTAKEVGTITKHFESVV